MPEGAVLPEWDVQTKGMKERHEGEDTPLGSVCRFDPVGGDRLRGQPDGTPVERGGGIRRRGGELAERHAARAGDARRGGRDGVFHGRGRQDRALPGGRLDGLRRLLLREGPCRRHDAHVRRDGDLLDVRAGDLLLELADPHALRRQPFGHQLPAHPPGHGEREREGGGANLHADRRRGAVLQAHDAGERPRAGARHVGLHADGRKRNGLSPLLQRRTGRDGRGCAARGDFAQDAGNAPESERGSCRGAVPRGGRRARAGEGRRGRRQGDERDAGSLRDDGGHGGGGRGERGEPHHDFRQPPRAARHGGAHDGDPDPV